MHPAFRQITMEELLSHHAGIPPFDKFKVGRTTRAVPIALPQLSGSEEEERFQFSLHGCLNARQR